MNARKITAERISFIFLLLTLVIILFFVLTVSKAESFLWLNQQHSPAADFFFTYFTFLGDGWASIITGVVIFFILSKRLGYKIIAAYIISGLLAQLLKKLFSLPRPKAFFTDGFYQYFIDGVTYSGFNSFPSGHTTSAFALAMVLSLYTKNSLLRVIYMVIAFAVGYSRIYLGQHFLEDVFCGAIIGLLTGYLIYKYLPMPVFRKRSAGDLIIP